MTCSRWACDPRYSTNARTLYSILVTYADTQERHTAKGKPYRVELAAQLGVSLSTLDRTFVEMEVAGMVTIEERPDPANPLHHDANVYHLHDAEVMFKGADAWADPLPSGVKAADVAKKVIEERRREKREKGIVRKGGVPKGVNPKAVKAAKKAAQTEQVAPSQAPETPSPEAEDEGGGSSTHAATPSSTHAARVAAPMLLTVYSPFQSPSPDDEALAGRSPVDGRRPSVGSSTREAEGDFVASSKDSSPGDETAKSGTGAARGQSTTAATGKAKHTREQLDIVRSVRAYFPADVLNGWEDKKTGVKVEPLPEFRTLSDAILAALEGDAPGADRTAAQLGARIEQRWNQHGYATDYYAGKIKNLRGAAVAMVRPLKPGDRYYCSNPRCDNGTNIDTHEDCGVCALRIEQKKAEGRQQENPVPTGDADTVDSASPMPAQRSSYMTLHTPVPDRECEIDACAAAIPEDVDDTLCPRCRKRANDQAETDRVEAALAARYEAPEPELAYSATAPF
jgi:hypothetical protein